MPDPDSCDLDPAELLARALGTVRPTAGGEAWTPPEPEELARLFPQYRIESLLGRGGMGAVYKAWQPSLDRPIAIKLLPAEFAADASFVARFQREARTLAKLQHARIVTIHDSGQTSEGHLYFVMEYIDGTDLRKILRGPGLDPEQALAVVGQLCDALQAAHRVGIVHRDIKPENVLVTSDGYVKLADFGLARPPQEDGVTELTGTNVVMGTPSYMAPEQHLGAAHADPRSDIFSLGVMFYEMLTGRRPQGVFDPPSHRVQVDVRIDEVVLKALQSEPARRYQNVNDLKSDVERIQSTPPPVAPAPTSTRPPRVVHPPGPRKTNFAVAPVIAVLLGIIAFLVVKKNAPTPLVVAAESTPAPAIPAAPTAPTPVRATPTPTPALVKAATPAPATPAVAAKATPPPPSPSPSTGVLLEMGFEAPLKEGPFGTGAGLAGQAPKWSLFADGEGVNLPPMARIQTALVRSGRQALEISATAGNRHPCGVSTSVENTAQLIIAEADVYLRHSAKPSDWQFGLGDDSVHSFVCGFHVLSDNGKLRVMMDGWPVSPPVVKREVWMHYVLRCDLKKQTYDVIIDGEAVAPGAPFLTKTAQLRIFQFNTFANGDDTAVIDNVILHTGPEPLAGKVRSGAPATPQPMSPRAQPATPLAVARLSTPPPVVGVASPAQSTLPTVLPIPKAQPVSFKSIKDILDLIPKEPALASAGHPNPAALVLAAKELNVKAARRLATLQVRVDKIEKTRGETKVYASGFIMQQHEDRFSWAGNSLEVALAAFFPESEASNLSKLTPGKEVTVTGLVANAGCVPSKIDKRQIRVWIDLAECSVGREFRPSTPPQRWGME